MKSILKLFILMILGIPYGNTQEYKNATIIAEIPVGPQKYYILQEQISSEYYKTSVSNIGLIISEIVQLKFDNRPDDMVEVISPILNEFLLAKRIQSPVNEMDPKLFYQLPINVNGVLFFTSKDHLASVYELTDNYAHSNPESYEMVINRLDNIESNFSGFQSYRKYFDNKYELDIVTYSLEEIRKIEMENFISDEVLNTYFNSFRLIGIGDSIYYYNDRETILAVKSDNQAGINYLMGLARLKDSDETFDAFSITQLELEQNKVSYSNKRKKKYVSKGLYSIQVGSTTTVSYQTIPQPVNNPNPSSCNPKLKGIWVEIDYSIVDGASSSYASYTHDENGFLIRTVTLIVNWGDGTTTTTNNYNGQSVIYHTYPNFQIYNVTTEVVLNDFLVSGSNVSVYDGQGYPGSSPIIMDCILSCGDNDKEAWDEKISSNGQWRMHAKGWINDNIFGNHIGGYTHAYKKDGNGWKRDKAYIYIKVDGIFRNEYDCNLTESKSGEKDHNNDKKIEKVKTKFLTRYSLNGNGDVKTKHKLIKGNITLETTITLNPC
jgi:hypothetical protein